jgi:hypothetical protein
MAELVPRVFYVQSAEDHARYGRILLDFGPTGTKPVVPIDGGGAEGEGWLVQALQVQQAIAADGSGELAALDARLQVMRC